MPIITGFLSKINKKIIIAVIMVLIVSIFIVLIAAKDSEIHKKEKEIAQYQEDIKGLELNNQTLQNEILFIKENEKFQNSFSNSSLMIKNIDEELLTRTENETFNSISNNFYKYFNNANFMQYKNKICQSTAFYASRNIYNQVRNKSARFNEKIPRKYYKDWRMAAMVQHTSRNELLLI
ncbi:VSH-1 phage-like protein [Brachyspira sp. G79]|nr:VSH-1 phage-like protein [Brachyspira sp. G79]